MPPTVYTTRCGVSNYFQKAFDSGPSLVYALGVMRQDDTRQTKEAAMTTTTLYSDTRRTITVSSHDNRHVTITIAGREARCSMHARPQPVYGKLYAKVRASGDNPREMVVFGDAVIPKVAAEAIKTHLDKCEADTRKGYDADKARLEAEIPGIGKLQDAQNRFEASTEASRLSMDDDSDGRAMLDGIEPREAYKALLSRYPRATLYLTAETCKRSSLDATRKTGRTACRILRDGGPVEDAKAVLATC